MAFLGGDMSNHRLRVFSTAFKEDVVRRLESGEALASVSKELGIVRKLLYEWRWAWRRHGAAGLNRRRGPKAGFRRKVASGDPPGAALASSAPSAEGTSASIAELARAKARIEELERLVGRQQLDLDFFRKALRLVDVAQGPTPARRETNSTRSSKI
jgi:transposase